MDMREKARVCVVSTARNGFRCCGSFRAANIAPMSTACGSWLSRNAWRSRRLVEAQQRFSDEAIHVAQISAISEEEYAPALFFMPDGPWVRSDGPDRESTVESEPPEAGATLPRYESKPAAARWKPMQLLRPRFCTGFPAIFQRRIAPRCCPSGPLFWILSACQICPR